MHNMTHMQNSINSYIFTQTGVPVHVVACVPVNFIFILKQSNFCFSHCVVSITGAAAHIRGKLKNEHEHAHALTRTS